MSAPALVCATLEVALNRYLRLEPATLADCAKLEGRAIALVVSDLDWRIVIEPTASGVRVSDGAEVAISVTASAATPQLLAAALRSTAGNGVTLPTGLRIDGDAELLHRFSRLLRRVGFDLEEPLARVVGDAAAHRLVGGLRGLLGWSRNAAQRLTLDTAEYLREETGDLASAPDVDEWMNAVDTLREGADRFEARLVRIERQHRKEGRG